MDDNLWTLLKLGEFAVREDTGKLEDGGLEGI
jgi:hypothetical protein